MELEVADGGESLTARRTAALGRMPAPAVNATLCFLKTIANSVLDANVKYHRTQPP
jgi:hypothetical protein